MSFICLIFILSIYSVKCLNILLLNCPIPARFYPAATLARELMRRGHQVTTFLPLQNETMFGFKPNYLDLLADAKVISVKFDELTKYHEAEAGKYINGTYDPDPTGSAIAREVLGWMAGISRAYIQESRKIKTPADVWLFDPGVMGAPELAMKSGALPVGLMPNSFHPLGSLFQTAETDNPFSLYYEHVSPSFSMFPAKLTTLTQRLGGWHFGAFLWTMSNLVFTYQIFTNADALGVEHGLLPPTSFPMLYSTMTPMEAARSLSPLVFHTGPWFEPDLSESVKNPKVFAKNPGLLGTSFRMEPKHVTVLLEVINGVRPKRVLWSLPKYSRQLIKDVQLPENLRLELYTPQKSVLAHANVLVFVSQCGSNSVHEGPKFGVPVLCLPFVPGMDQYNYGLKIAEMRAGDVIPWDADMSSDRVIESVVQLTGDPSFKEGAERLGRIAQFAGGVERAADVVEFLHENGYEHLVPPSGDHKNLNWYQRKNIDMVVCLSFELYIVYRIIKFLVVNCCCRCFCKKDREHKKSKKD